ncbi:hypothetical protein D3273_25285 [Lichenibacterium minor]|uniref:Helix-turn-helix domain-containing protein n=1 Tax=Lichenibacterium minor TaxID=2316528 RepID=A0A4Q2U2S1_9HYPH|nr:hypothetical protein [Lichenibacterium minor]RYC29181.1 hypothetical protein D3273_25285 [Lichenibacterium minor]
MIDDPILARLAARAASAMATAAAATAAVQAYLETGVVEQEDDLVSLKDAETEYRRSNDTLRRWATEEELGVKVAGKWFLSRSLVRRFKSG